MIDTNTNNYWNNKGRYQALADQLQPKIPAEGSVVGAGNKALEKFRLASNAYYDLFNNGGGNLPRDIARYFNISGWLASQVSEADALKDIYSLTEPAMDEIVLAAALEQRVGMTLKEFKGRPGTKLRTEYGTPIMVIALCPGMIRGDGGPDAANGGDETVPIVNLETGQTNFEHVSLNVVPAKGDA